MAGSKDFLVCHFAEKGFRLQTGRRAVPCQTRYHTECVKLGIPFRTRLKNGKGLYLPKAMSGIMPLFVCKCCTVRAHEGREIQFTACDASLMCFERMRIIDMAHNWAHGTQRNYRGKIRNLRWFKQRFGTTVL